jgi:hypothetical protein
MDDSLHATAVYLAFLNLWLADGGGGFTHLER